MNYAIERKTSLFAPKGLVGLGFPVLLFLCSGLRLGLCICVPIGNESIFVELFNEDLVGSVDLGLKIEGTAVFGIIIGKHLVKMLYKKEIDSTGGEWIIESRIPLATLFWCMYHGSNS